jgi:hypothetical protein
MKTKLVISFTALSMSVSTWISFMLLSNAPRERAVSHVGRAPLPSQHVESKSQVESTIPALPDLTLPRYQEGLTNHPGVLDRLYGFYHDQDEADRFADHCYAIEVRRRMGIFVRTRSRAEGDSRSEARSAAASKPIQPSEIRGNPAGCFGVVGPTRGTRLTVPPQRTERISM